MATIRILLGIICLTAFGGYSLSGRNYIANGAHIQHTDNSPKQHAQRTLVLAIAGAELYVRESTGHNDGSRVEQYQHYTANVKGDPWCASFVSWVFGQANFKKPCTAWSPALFPGQKRTAKPLPGDVFGIYFSSLKRIAHCGLVNRKSGDWVYTIEGNTNSAGSREGDGVYQKIRHRRTIACYANWINKAERGGQP